MTITSDLTEKRSPNSQLVAQLQSASIIISLITICLGSIVIIGWLFNIAWLKSIIANRVTMQFSTALGLSFGGISLLCWHQRQKRSNLVVLLSLYLLPISEIAFSLLTLIEYAYKGNLGTNWLFFPDSTTVIDALFRARMSPNTALNFLLWNTAILLLIQKYYFTAQLLVTLVAAIASVGLIGHIYDNPLLYGIDSATGMAIHTAVGFILLALAFLAACSERGWMRVITTEQAGGLMARWLLPLVVVIPPTLSGLFWFLFRGNVDELKLMIPLRIMLEMIIFGVIIWWIANKLNQIDRQKQEFSQRLLDTERRFRAIFDQTFQFIGLLTPEGTVLEANQTALDFGGISKSEVIGKPFWETHWWRISPQTQQQLQNAIAKAQTGAFVRYPVEVQGANQQTLTIDFSLRPLKNEAGEVVLLIPEGRDITQQQAALQEREQAELALQQSEARYKAIIEDQTELICRHRPDATLSYVNDAFCRYFGIHREQLIDRKYTPVVYEADRERVVQLVNSMNQSNPTVTIENRVVAQGKVRWTQWNNRLIFDAAGNECEYQSVGRDITALKEIEAKLRESEEKFRRAFEDAATGEALVAPDGKFMQVNRSLCEIVGYSETELLNKTFQEITHPNELNLDLSYIQQMLAGEIRTYQMEKRYFHKQGHLVWILLSVSLVRHIDGEILYFIAQIQDINQRKQAEVQLHKLVKELERSNQELDEFASVVSHDLLSPVRKQQMLVDLFQLEYSQVLDEQGQEYLSKMQGLNVKMEGLIRSLLAFARVTTQTKPFTLVSLNEIIKDVLYDLETEIAQTKAKIVVGNLPTIKCDRSQMCQLFQNLVQNALKFQARDQIPEIKIYQLLPQENTLQDNFYQIVVTDNGIGFESEQQEKIFTPFHRLHSYSKYKGTGLGLAICDKIVKRHHGAISASSEPQQGATFTICLPKHLLSSEL